MYKMDIGCRYVDFYLVGIFECQVFLKCIAFLHGFDADIFSNPIGDMHDNITLLQIQQAVNRRGCADRTDSPPDRVSSEDFMVIARVEALIAGWGQEEALRRAHAYVEAGADAILIHSKLSTPDEIVSFVKAWDFSAPLVIVPTAYPMIKLDEIERLGIKMVIYANHGLRAAIRAINEVYSEINRAGRLDTIKDRIVPMNEVFEYIFPGLSRGG